MHKFDLEFWQMIDKLMESHQIVIDRKKGTRHPRYHDYIYPLDYGYLEGTVSSDGDGIDVWIGTSDEKVVKAMISSVDFIKGDSEIKLLYACSDDEVQMVYEQHNRSDGMKGILTLRKL